MDFPVFKAIQPDVSITLMLCSNTSIKIAAAISTHCPSIDVNYDAFLLASSMQFSLWIPVNEWPVYSDVFSEPLWSDITPVSVAMMTEWRGAER